MSVSILGVLCLGFMAVLFLGMIVSTIILLATNKDPRFWAGLAKVGAIGVPILGGALFLLLFLGMTWTSARRVESQQAVVRHLDEEHRQIADSIRIRTEQEVAEKLREDDRRGLSRMPESPAMPVAPGNDLRPVLPETPADALVAVVPETQALPAKPNPRGDLRTSPRPDWLNTGTTKEGYVTTTVLSSSLFATEQEAEEDAKSRFAGVITADVVAIGQRHGFVSLGSLPVEREKLLPIFLKDRYVEVEARDLGTVTAPMYRVWMKLEQSPQTQKQLAEHYRHYITDFRMLFVGLLVAGFLAIPVAILGTSRGIRATKGRGSFLWKGAGVMAVLAVWLFGMYLLRTNSGISP